MSENKLLIKKHILLCIDEQMIQLNQSYAKELDYIKNNFCGLLINNYDDIEKNYVANSIIFVCGNIEQICANIQNKTIYVIKQLSENYYDNQSYKVVDIGQVPINVHNQGIFFKKFFDTNYFNLVETQHEFQTLTESNKPNNALRKGIYLSKVLEEDDELKFNLLRCSSNLSGPTDNFKSADNEIIDKLNNIAEQYFENKVEFNHVLAQIYYNDMGKKAKIKAHSDKSKDMGNGLISFCTFYKSYSEDKFEGNEFINVKKSKDDLYDYYYKNASVLTKLRFRLKDSVVNREGLVKEFSVTLYPNSVFIINLLTNRLYTHEIVPSSLPTNLLPIRLGYVVRCSNTYAKFKDNQTYIVKDGQYMKLEKANENDIEKLRELYFKENTTDEVINYGDIYFSMNDGDYMRPNL
jgi:hypothetical protein